MWVVREGYEGLVRGNSEASQQQAEQVHTFAEASVQAEVRANAALLHSGGAGPDTRLLHNLRFGDGELLKDGTTEFVGGRTLKGRYIVRVGWGRCSRVVLSGSCSTTLVYDSVSLNILVFLGWNSYRDSPFNDIQDRRRPNGRRA